MKDKFAYLTNNNIISLNYAKRKRRLAKYIKYLLVLLRKFDGNSQPNQTAAPQIRLLAVLICIMKEL